MASRFATVTKEEHISIKETTITKNTKMATKFGWKALHGKLLIFQTAYSKAKNKKYNALFTKIVKHFNYTVK